jgi:transcriptional regulator with XRE-family HTH domain
MDRSRNVARKKTGHLNATIHAQTLRELGERVRAARMARKLTQQDLAVALGMSVAYLSLIERGGRNPPFATVVRIGLALGVPVSRLFPGG